MAVIVHDMWREAPEVPGLDEFAACMEKFGLRVHHVFHDPTDEDDGFWTIEVERSQRMEDGRLHMQFFQVSPQFIEHTSPLGWSVVAELLEREQVKSIEGDTHRGYVLE